VWVCLCKAVNSTSVVNAIGAGATSVQAVSAACGAATDCGRCTRTIFRMLVDLGVRSPTEPLEHVDLGGL
jgi:bacterioferritin-associated ferredoxin